MNTYYLCIALLLFLLLALGLLVSLARFKYMAIYGYADDPEHMLYKLVRAHSNTAEYAPALMVVMYILSLSPQASWVDWCVILVTFCRYLFVVGLLFPKTMAKPNPARFLGALGTYIFGLGLCLALFQQVMTM